MRVYSRYRGKIRACSNRGTVTSELVARRSNSQLSFSVRLLKMACPYCHLLKYPLAERNNSYLYMEQMKIRLVEGQHKSFSTRNWAHPKLALAISGGPAAPLRSLFGQDTYAQGTWDHRPITGTPQ